jgi:Cu2+-exporting ATPase
LSITCAACIWLNEQHVGRLPGDGSQYQLYDPPGTGSLGRERIKLSDILGAIAAIGYRAYPYDAAKNEEISNKERRGALWRLWVAGFGMMQVMMYAFPVYIADGDMSPDVESLMRWAACFLTIPVIFIRRPFFPKCVAGHQVASCRHGCAGSAGRRRCLCCQLLGNTESPAAVYFDSVTILLGGRYLEMTARQKALGVTEALASCCRPFLKKCQIFRLTAALSNASLLICIRVILCWFGREIVPADGCVIEGVSCANEFVDRREQAGIQVAGRCGHWWFDQRRESAGGAGRTGGRGHPPLGDYSVDGAGGR